MKNYIQKGDTLEFTAASDVKSGEMVLVGNIVGVAVNDVANGATGVVNVTGVYEVPKEADAISKGASLYFKASTKSLTTTAQGNTFAGWAWSDQLAGDGTVLVHLIL